MNDVILAFQISAYLGVILSGVAMFLMNVAWYRRYISIALFSILTLSIIHNGWTGALIVVFSVTVILPTILLLICKAMAAAVWFKVRRSFPDEPKTAPGKPATLPGMYRLIWKLDSKR